MTQFSEIANLDTAPPLLTLAEACQVMRWSRASFYRRADRLEVKKDGKRVLITTASLRRFIANLPPASIRPAA